MLRRIVHRRVRLTNSDRLFLILLYRWFPTGHRGSSRSSVQRRSFVRHQASFRRYWRWKSRSFGGRPRVDAELRALIRRMSVENRLWGAPRIHGELLKLSGLKSRNRASPNTGLSGMDRQVRTGAHFCATTRRTLPRWIYSLSRPLASTCSMPSSLFGWTGESWSGSTLHKILRQNGSRARLLPHQRSGPYLSRGCSTPNSRHGHTRQTYRAGVTLAERFYRKADRIDPA